jgi:hypothetical protein
MGLELNRRKFLVAAGTGAAAISFSEPRPVLAQQVTRSPLAVKPEMANVKALVFDTFGTVVDWRSSVIAEGMAWGKARGLNINWVDFADRWRLGYKPTMDKVRKGEIPWTRLDDLHRIILNELLKELKIEGLTEEEKIPGLTPGDGSNPGLTPSRGSRA